MRITIAYYLLLVYTVAVCKPVLPVLKDIAAHIFWKAGHLAAVHHHSGNNHVHDEIQEAKKHDEKGSTSQASKNPEPSVVHLSAKNTCDLTLSLKANDLYPVKVYLLQYPLSETISPPPRYTYSIPLKYTC